MYKDGPKKAFAVVFVVIYVFDDIFVVVAIAVCRCPSVVVQVPTIAQLTLSFIVCLECCYCCCWYYYYIHCFWFKLLLHIFCWMSINSKYIFTYFTHRLLGHNEHINQSICLSVAVPLSLSLCRCPSVTVALLLFLCCCPFVAVPLSLALCRYPSVAVPLALFFCRCPSVNVRLSMLLCRCPSVAVPLLLSLCFIHFSIFLKDRWNMFHIYLIFVKRYVP